MVYLYNKIRFSSEKKKVLIYSERETQKRYAKSKKPEIKKHMQYDPFI